MKNTTTPGIQRGQAITFRIPSDTPDYALRQLQRLKETEKRNFSSEIAKFVLDGAGKTLQQDRESITIPLPQKLTKSQRDWLKHAHSEAMLGSILYHLLSDPLRATALLASLTSNSLEIDEALYLQEQASTVSKDDGKTRDIVIEQEKDFDLDDFDWGQAQNSDESESAPEKEESLDDLLGDFLAQMNK